MSNKEFRKNHEIRIPEVYLIDEQGEKRGVMPTRDALAIAQQAGLDLVEVSPQARPPVVKIMNFGKLLYEKERQLRKNKVQKKTGELKGIRLSVKIGEHDMMVRVKSAQKFLDKGNKLKIEMQLRGREKAHPELVEKVVKKFLELLEREVVVESPIKRQGSRFSTIVSMKK
ncbi:MAG: translation initiation factor IF-3 [Candidatus Kerfeldbacteria bacterium]